MESTRPTTRPEWRLAAETTLIVDLCRDARHQGFNHPWEAAASLKLRAGDDSVLDVYEAKGRIIPAASTST